MQKSNVERQQRRQETAIADYTGMCYDSVGGKLDDVLREKLYRMGQNES